jgi:hypothetical protein
MSPSLFETSILPGLRKIIDHLDSAVVHLHPGGYTPIEPLLETTLIAIELHRDMGGVAVSDLIPLYRRIQDRKPLVVWGDLSLDEMRLLRGSVDLDRLAVKPVVRSLEEAEEVWAMMKG